MQRRRERTRGGYSAQTHAFNPKYNDFGFDSDQVSKLDNANLKTWSMSRRWHFRPPDPRLNYEPDWTRRMCALGHEGDAGVYNRATYKAQMAQALTRWAEHVRAVVTGTPEKIVPLRAAS